MIFSFLVACGINGNIIAKRDILYISTFFEMLRKNDCNTAPLVKTN